MLGTCSPPASILPWAPFHHPNGTPFHHSSPASSQNHNLHPRHPPASPFLAAEKLQLRFQIFPIPLDTAQPQLLSLTRKGEHVNTKIEIDCR